MNNIKAWLTLHLTPNLGALGCKRLVEFFGGPVEVFKAKKADLSRVPGVKKGAIDILANRPPFEAAEKEIVRAEKLGIRILCLDGDEYPSLLRAIYAPPVVLYARGRLDALQAPCTAIVGSRAATSYGMKVARQMAADLTFRGVQVVSGMALGIDTAAHAGSLESGGATIAVLGCGVDVVYPRQNAQLYNRIMGQGLIVSEYPLGTRPEGFRFPARNRIISGMAQGVLVVEAAQKSGSLITARMALEEGREVFAVPGRVDSFKSTGTHKLLQDGAKLVHSVDDILEEYVFDAALLPQSSREKLSLKQEESVGTAEEKTLLDILDAYPQDVDSIIRKSGLPAAKVNETLLLLEIKGRIERQSGHKFSLKT